MPPIPLPRRLPSDLIASCHGLCQREHQRADLHDRQLAASPAHPAQRLHGEAEGARGDEEGGEGEPHNSPTLTPHRTGTTARASWHAGGLKHTRDDVHVVNGKSLGQNILLLLLRRLVP